MSITRHYLNILLAVIVAAILWTVAFVYLPSHELVSVGYGFGLLGFLEFFGTIILLATSCKVNYITNAAFPLQARRYLYSNLAFTIVVVALLFLAEWAMPTKLFVFLHLLLVGFYLWRILAMDSGQELIENAEMRVAARTTSWKNLRVEAETLLKNCQEDYRKELAFIRDAICYADPMTVPQLEPLNQEIVMCFEALKNAVATKQGDAVAGLCADLQKKIQERAQKLKTLK